MMKNKYVKQAVGNRQSAWLMLIVIAASFASCNNFLDKGPLDVLSQNNFWQTAAQLDLYIAGKYSWLPETDFYGDAVSDNMMTRAGQWSQYMNGQTVTPTAAGSGGWDWRRVYEINYFFDHYQRRIQVTNATFRSWFINWLKTWFGVSKLSLFLGLLFSSFSTKLIYSSVMVSKFVFLGIYWRTKPLRFSFAPLSQLW